jgi:phosphatidyl-myo-inositol dimannoside synthase
VLTVARLDAANAYKGVDTLLYAWPLVLTRVPGAILRVVGAGTDRARLERIAGYLGVAWQVRFDGWLPDADLAAAYQAARAFALPGRIHHTGGPAGEGFGLVFLEAAAAGLPCVAGRAGGALEAVVDGETGLLVDPESPRDVAGAIAFLLTQPAEAQRMGAAGRARVAEQFVFGRFADDVARTCRVLVGAP